MSQKKIYVGSLNYSATEDDLNDFFSQYGETEDIKLIKDRETNRSKGFAFITFKEQEAAKNALDADGKEIKGRKVRVNPARTDDRRRSRGGHGHMRGQAGIYHDDRDRRY